MTRLVIYLALVMCCNFTHAFDHTHSSLDSLLKQHVVMISNGNASRLDYHGMLSDRAELKMYLESISTVDKSEYQHWTRDQQLAFLINAYNAYTIDLVLTEYPDLQSIKDLGSFFQSPWRKSFFSLLGEVRHLDNLEHDLIRDAGVFNEPRIHFAVNCASVGCPMLRNEAFLAEYLDMQLEDSLVRFLSDSTRNRFDQSSRKLQISKLFKWYEEDFEKGFRGFTSLKITMAKYADIFAADSSEVLQTIQSGNYSIEYLDYDWSLNDSKD
jgi:hypothetical protein